MNIQYNIDLQKLNTFAIPATAESYVEINHPSELEELPIKSSDDYFVLGGGSNVLFTESPKGLVIKMNLKGIEIIEETNQEVIVKVAAGENWHEWVLYTVRNNWSGIENMSLIPGSVGASPMQNIGAYGVEIKDVFVELEAFHIDSKAFHQFKKEDCDFGYRESVFKRRLKGQYIITSVTYRLQKTQQLNIAYGAISKELEAEGITEPTIRDVSDIVIKIRQSKLPDIHEIGSAGSFFKNPILPNEEFARIQNEHPEIPFYIVSETETKVPAGWLIEHAGWKGKTFGNYGVYPKQALVLVNYGGAKGQEIYQLSEEIIRSVKSQYGIDIEREVNII